MATTSYFDFAALAHEQVTIFTPLAGRTTLLPGYVDWLMFQTWPHSQTSLLLLETVPFDERALDCLMLTQFPDVRIVQRQFGSPETRDRVRDQKGWQVIGPVMAQIYGWMRSNITTPWVLVVEDDVVPPLDVIERLMRSVGPETVSVSAAVPERASSDRASKWIAWDRRETSEPQRDRPGTGVEPIGGNGFGCVLLRTAAIRAQPFTADPPFDRAWYRAQPPGTCLIDWSAVCQHRDG